MIFRLPVLCAAFALDLVIGDPSYPLHPVRLIGKSISQIERVIYPLAPGYLGGFLLFAVCSVFWTAVGFLLAPFWWAHLFLLYSFLAEGQLIREVISVARSLSCGELDRARSLLSYLVTRDTGSFDASEVSRCALETLAENTSDGFFGPAIAYLVGGLPLLLLYKVVETGDSMVGYKTERYRRFGFFFARADDLFNYIPARVCALFLALAAPMLGASPLYVLRRTFHMASLHESPNAGWPEAAFASILGIRFGGVYVYFKRKVFKTPLGEDKTLPPDVASIYAGALISLCSCILFTLSCAAFLCIFAV